MELEATFDILNSNCEIPFKLLMRINENLKVQRKSLFSTITYVLSTGGITGTLKMPFFNNLAFYSGKDLYLFRPLDFVGNSFQIVREDKCMGYIHFHTLRNLAQINLLVEGPFQFSLKGVISGNWVMRQGRKSLEKLDADLLFNQTDALEKELLVACGMFTSAKINKDLLLFVPVIALLWFICNLL